MMKSAMGWSAWMGLALLIGACSDDGGARIAPDTAIDQGPAAVSNQRRIQITFRNLGTANRFECRLDGGAPSACISPFEADVDDGEHTFAVAAALNEALDETPATHTWRTDTAPPDTELTAAPPALDSSSTPTFEFRGSDPGGGGVTFECAIDGGTFAACTAPLVPTLDDGDHQFAVRAVDQAGNVDPTPAEHAWTIAATPPETDITSGPEPGSTTPATGSFAFTSPEASATFECAFDTAAFEPCTSPVPFDLPSGPHTFAVRAVSATNLVDPLPATRSWTVDATPPDVSITSTPTNPSNVLNPTFAFTSGDPTATFECQIDGVVAFAACTSPWTTNVPEGARTFRVRATDPVGNQSPPVTYAWTVDATPPNVSITSTPTNPSNVLTPTFAFTSGDPTATFECQIDGVVAFTACTSPWTTNVPEGARTFRVRATDPVGNQSPPVTYAWTVDATPPNVSITSTPTNPSNVLNPTFAFASGDPTARFECQVDGVVAFTACTSPWTTNVPEGARTFRVRATDPVGNQSPPATYAWTVDVTPPTVTLTSVPPALSNNPSPSVGFTVAGGATSIECRVDSGAFAPCTSPFAPGALADGSHTITVRATDAATNSGSAATTFAIDTVAPVATITSAPPAEWPVDYFDFAFTVTGATAVECSLNSGAFEPCTSPYPVRTTYDVASKLVVRGRDAAGNVGSATATWTARPGLVLHYPWEQGATHNTSLLSQVPALTVDGGEPVPPDSVVGGWAGTAIGNAPAIKYPGSERPLQSSPSGAYTMTFWIRATESALTTNLISNANGMEGGFVLAMEGPTLRLEAFSGGQRFTGQARIQINRWVHVALRTTSPAKPIEVLVDGKLAISVTTTGNAAFGEGQSTLVVGPLGKLDLDDLRFYNLALSNDEVCTRSARGTMSGGSCLPFRPGLELDFETGVVDTGAWRLPFIHEGSVTFVSGRTGMAAVLASGVLRYLSGFREAAAAQPSRSLSFWIDGANEGIVWDTTLNCGSAAPATCGIRISYRPGQLAIFANGSSQTSPSNGSVSLPSGRNSVVITERRSGLSTVSLSVYVNGRGPTVIPINGGDIFTGGSDSVSVMMPGLLVDELELWPGDLSADPERLCENGFDGEFDHVTRTCNLTAN